MKNIKILLFALCFAGLSFSPAGSKTARAAQVTVGLAPGQVYAFSHSDPRAIAYVSVSGAARYEYVSYDQYGTAVEFGAAGGRCPVRGGGVTYISVPASVSASYDNAAITVSHEPGAALARQTIAPGQSLALANRDTDRASVSVAEAGGAHTPYDCVIRDDEGETVFYALQSRFTAQHIPAQGSAVFTAGADTLTLLYPAMGGLRAADESRAALSTHDLTAEQHRTLVNTSTVPYEVTVSAGAVFAYGYALQDEKGYTVEESGNERGGKLNVPAGHSLSFTPKMDATLYFPADWQNKLTVSFGGPAASGLHELAPGRSLTVVNDSPGAAFDLRVGNKQPQRDFTYDFFLEDGPEARYGKDAAAGVIALPPGASLTLTAGADETLEVRVPAHAAAREHDDPAVAVFPLGPNASAVAVNRGAAALTLTPQSEATTGFIDFTQKDGEDALTDFGRLPLREAFTLEAGHTRLLTNASQSPAELVYPAKWLGAGLTVTASEAPALAHITARENQGLYIENVNRRYDYAVKAEGDETPAAFDYALTDAKGLVTDYGVNTGGALTIPADGRLAVMPQKGSALRLYYPAEWDGAPLKPAKAETTPLYHVTLKPGEKLTLYNRSRKEDFTVQTNSYDTAARYFLREGRRGNAEAPPEAPPQAEIAVNINNTVNTVNDETSTSTEVSSQGTISLPIYMPAPAEDTGPPADLPLQGDIAVPVGKTFTVTAAPGGDLKLWIPWEWVKQLVR